MTTTRTRTVRTIRRAAPSAERLRADWRDATVHFWAFRIAAVLTVICMVTLTAIAPDELTGFLLGSATLLVALACFHVDRIQRADVRIARAAWLHRRLGL